MTGAERSGARGSGRVTGAVRSVGRALHLPFTGPARGIRKATHAHGAGESGLGKLIELHGVNGAGDVMITVSLASTVFFSVPTDEARGRVALYLAITLAPFALLAPVVGPLLDRLPHGRRAAMACAMLARALLALLLVGAVETGSLQLYPAALGVLVASKAYGVVRSAVVPRLLPPRFSLVKANSRVTLCGLLATGVAAPIGAGLQALGPRWPLYGAFVIFVAGTFLSFTLPAKVDSAKGEDRALLAADPEHLHGPHRSETLKRPGLRTVGPAVTHALAANAALRGLSGFLIFFLAFLLRIHPLHGQSAAVSLGMVAVAAGTGNALGTAVGAWAKQRSPELIIVTVVAVELGVAITAALFFSAFFIACLAAVAGFSQALSKLCLDALIQRDVPELVRTSAFARSETLLQMAWVVGGAIGIALPLNGTLGMAVAAAIVAAGWLTTVRGLLSSARHGGAPRARVA
ncbi:putative integral membrane protein [Streptomyces scabiei 87.22]|uniref:Putative integral membrane protein n=8 Tax=Streptomyces scabiei TaxID=1930 RepID=C9YTI1_STRSW|nr:MFS transporter [Streptomyces sp. LBUM 1484]MBP5868075.1 MFS transporter [Streptomyces sp. LBUM 1485]MBP5876534.1 MFS transporter [Streptomyces sp. LBUM 1477]MBP5892893.1 MFS transporter [Streptomyces sp. LBUM 1481]MBP5900307.1 MFS transporter [Streptomyces sp. LBUM 1488]MBP5916110.1 MFS transporter [Streptomyces sp. LBUM 1486]MBP5923153.1 MFS transporter [Streptomyces sp. LBUM 1483]MBP5930733.1 MFS transporter [Streptomyces sp. LBUM 1479]QTU46726.1 MFS transporter [Streptomyces sp. LBUM